MDIPLTTLLREEGFDLWDKDAVDDLFRCSDIFALPCRSFLYWNKQPFMTLAIDGRGECWIVRDLCDLREYEFRQYGFDTEQAKVYKLH